MSFEQLIHSIATLSKAQAIDISKTNTGADGENNDGTNADGAGTGGTQAEAVAAGGAQGQGSGQGEGGAAQAAPAAGQGEAAALVKSLSTFEVEVEGEKFEGADAGEILKSLTDLASHIDASEVQIKEALGAAVIVMGTQSQQIGEMAKALASQTAVTLSLRSDLDALRNQPSGRRSVANPAQAPGAALLTKSLATDGSAGLPPAEFLAKCLSLQKDGALSFQDVAMAEAAIGSRMEVPSHITQKVFSHK